MSKPPEDLRVRRTRKLLWEALMAELVLRPLEEITVKDICERAMVHRSTFYQHYEDKYALLEQGMRQMYEVLLAEVNKAPGAFSVDNPPPYFVHLFEHVAQHQHFYKLMLCGDGIGGFQQLVKEAIAEQAEAKIHALTPTHQEPVVPPAIYVQYVAGATLSLLAWWLENDMPHTPHPWRNICCCSMTLHLFVLDVRQDSLRSFMAATFRSPPPRQAFHDGGNSGPGTSRCDAFVSG